MRYLPMIGVVVMVAGGASARSVMPTQRYVGSMARPVAALLAGDAHGAAQCQMKVVSCNYAHLYSGTFGWSILLKAPGNSYSQTVTLNVVNGVATCAGNVVETDQGTTTNGIITGAGLFAIEFTLDSANAFVYNVTGACPTASGMGSPVRPADFNEGGQQTYPQRATKIEQALIVGNSTYPAPETDSLNNVTGQVRVIWNLKHK